MAGLTVEPELFVIRTPNDVHLQSLLAHAAGGGHCPSVGPVSLRIGRRDGSAGAGAGRQVEVYARASDERPSRWLAVGKTDGKGQVSFGWLPRGRVRVRIWTMDFNQHRWADVNIDVAGEIAVGDG